MAEPKDAAEKGGGETICVKERNGVFFLAGREARPFQKGVLQPEGGEGGLTKDEIFPLEKGKKRARSLMKER